MRVYERGSAVGRVVQAVLRPSDAGDNQLQRLGDGDDDEHEMPAQIRKLVAVCDAPAAVGVRSAMGV